MCEHPSKSKIGEHLKKLKSDALKAEDDAEIKAQAFVIINIGNMINPAFASHKDLLTDLGLGSTSSREMG